MSLSHRVTEILEDLFDKTLNALIVKPISTTNKSSTNLVQVDTTVNGTTILSANANRVQVFIQNQSSQPVLIAFGENPSISNYSLILSGSSGTRVGDGGSYVTDTWKGEIKGIVENGTADITIFEEVVT